MASRVEVRRVEDKAGRKQFLRFPWTIYDGDPYWVPPLLSEAKRLLDPAANPFFEHGRIELFLARRDGRPVGRIAAIVDSAHNRRYDEKTGFWGFFETVNDAGVAGALFDAAGARLRRWDMTGMRGPFNPNVNAECGLLAEGFDSMPAILMPYHPPYYVELVEGAGLDLHMELYAYAVPDHEVVRGRPVIRRSDRLAAAVRSRHPGLSVRTIDMARYEDEVLALGRLFNTARRENWGFVPATDAEILAMARGMKPIVDPRLVLACELDGKLAGCVMGVPDVNPVLKRMNGRLFPFGWIRFLAGKRRVAAVRAFGVAALPEHRHKGVAVLLIIELIRRILDAGYEVGEISWVAASNVRSLGVFEKALQFRRSKTYRIYERPL